MTAFDGSGLNGRAARPARRIRRSVGRAPQKFAAGIYPHGGMGCEMSSAGGRRIRREGLRSAHSKNTEVSQNFSFWKSRLRRTGKSGLKPVFSKVFPKTNPEVVRILGKVSWLSLSCGKEKQESLAPYSDVLHRRSEK
jgi:hypothetical protein